MKKLSCDQCHVIDVAGVEDKLQDGVRPTLEMLRNAGIRVTEISLLLY